MAKYERSMWKILVGLEKFAKVFESLIKFLYFLKLRSLRTCLNAASVDEGDVRKTVG